MALIDWKFDVKFNHPASFIKNLLPKPDRGFVGVNFLQIASPPAVPALNVQPINSAATGEIAPSAEFSFILLAIGHSGSITQSLYFCAHPGMLL